MSRSFWTESDSRIKILTWVILPLWFLAALAGSLLGVFDSGQRPPIALGVAAVLPVVVFVIWFFTSAEFQQYLRAANLAIITVAQTWRVGGLVFVALYYQGVLPGAFALPAGWGDFAIGVTAPLVAWAISSRRGLPKPAFVVWHLLGLLDLVTAVTLGILSSDSPVGILAGEVTTRPMGLFPLSMIPTFFVPLLVILHLIALERVRQARRITAADFARGLWHHPRSV